MKFGTGSNAELTQKYERVKVLNDIHTSKPKQTNIPDFQLRYSCKCLAHFNRSPIKQEVQAFRSAPISLDPPLTARQIHFFILLRQFTNLCN